MLPAYYSMIGWDIVLFYEGDGKGKIRFMPKLCAHHLGATTILIVLLACINTQAAQVVSLYSADIVVDSQSNTTYQKALPEALTNALIKASGNPSINSIDQIQNKLKQPEAFVQS